MKHLKNIYFLSLIVLCSQRVNAQNSPMLIWGNGLDGSTYQTSAIYSSFSTGLLFEAPQTGAGIKLPIKLGWRGGDLALTIAADGNIAIGTTDAKGYKLAVAGNMIAESVKVKLQSTWPDFVFAKEYGLPTLRETEAYIKEKGHLRGIPSAAEVKEKGVDLGEMNAKLLQKIEELTLYLIEKEKQILVQETKSEEQEQRIRNIEEQLKRLLK